MLRVAASLLFVVSVGCVQVTGPQPFTPPGPYKHAYTQLLFPEHIGRFDRMYVTSYDPDGANVSGHYQGPRALPSMATVYHYPATPDASPPERGQVLEHYAQAKRDIVGGTPGARLLSEQVVDSPINGLQLQGLHAVYALPEFPAYEGSAESHLYLYVLDGWYLKFRFSHPTEVSEAALEYEQEFLQSVTWPLPE